MTTPRIRDNDAGEITAELNGREIRGWSYDPDDRNERCWKMAMAREFAEGWYQAEKSSAAPDMLEALKALLADRGPERLRSKSWNKARAAIAKAEGGDA